jgi:hypothetical protein
MDRSRNSRAIWLILAVDTPVLVVLSPLIAKGSIPPYPIAVVIIGALFVSNFMIAWLTRAKQRGVSESNSRLRLSFLIPVVIFTVAGVVVIVDFLSHPSLPLGMQAGVAILFLSLLWFIAYRLHRGGNH